MRTKTGGDAHQDGKPSRWFAKSIALVLQKYRVGFYKPSRWFPVLLTSQARHHCHLCPFHSDCPPVSLMMFRRVLAHVVCRVCRLADPDKRTIAAPPSRQMRLRSCYMGVARQRDKGYAPHYPQIFIRFWYNPLRLRSEASPCEPIGRELTRQTAALHPVST